MFKQQESNGVCFFHLVYYYFMVSMIQTDKLTGINEIYHQQCNTKWRIDITSSSLLLLHNWAQHPTRITTKIKKQKIEHLSKTFCNTYSYMYVPEPQKTNEKEKVFFYFFFCFFCLLHYNDGQMNKNIRHIYWIPHGSQQYKTILLSHHIHTIYVSYSNYIYYICI